MSIGELFGALIVVLILYWIVDALWKSFLKKLNAQNMAEQQRRNKTSVPPPVTTHRPVPINTIPEPLKEFTITDGKLTAYNKKSETAVIPDGVLSIGDHAFKNTSELKKVVIPQSVKSIGKESFADCKKLLNIDIPDSVLLLGEGAFLRCNHLESIKLSKKIQTIEKNTFLWCSDLMNITLPQSITIIGDSAFCGCKNLQSIALPENIEHIGTNAFSSCKKLTSITIPKGIKSIHDRTFKDCHYLESVTLPDEIEKIGDEAFFNCYSLRNIRIPKRVTTIGVRAFAHCESLRSIDIPYGVTDIESYAFACCDNLTSITIPESVNYIGDNIFNCCNELLTIRAPAGSLAERYAQRNDIRFSAIVAQDKNKPTIHEIEFADFVVRSNTSSCYLNHDVETIEAFVSILSRDGSIRKYKIIAAYCRDCNCYYIMDSSFKYLQKKGVLLCQLITLAELKSKGSAVFSGDGMKAQSMLRRCGYTVNATTDLSAVQRQKILMLVLDNRIYSASELYSFLDWLIGYHGRSKYRDMSAAIEKWTADRNFVADYKVNSRRAVGINSISYHPKT